MPKRLRPLIALAAAGVVVAAVVAYVLLPPRQTDDVSVPPSNATPEQVVTAYLDALNAHDCGTAEALMAAGAEPQARSWCEDVASLTNIRVHDHIIEGEDSGHRASGEVANVPVDFDLSWRPFHDDGSMTEGPTMWGYLLVRDSGDAPWRIFDQGVG